MNGRSRRPLGVKYRYFIIFAVFFIALGIIIASNLEMNSRAVADIPSAGNLPVVKGDDGRYYSPFVQTIENVQNAVVNISATVNTDSSPYDDLFWHFFQIPRGPQTSFGSGFFFREDGYILTNSHVIRNADQVIVSTSAGYQYDAEVIGTDPQTDLAVLKVESEEEIAFIPFGNSDEILVGDWAIAIGNPFPQQGLDRTVTVGVISAKGRSNLRFGNDTPRYQDYIQTDASINPGNSGGPLINLRGEAIGVNSAISTPSGGSVGIGFAIPINIARAIVPDLITSGVVSRGWLGVWLSEVTQAEAKKNSLGAVHGVHIDSVFVGSPAARAGIKNGDILTSFNNQEILDLAQFSVLIATASKGQLSTIELVRNGRKQTVQTTIVDREEYLADYAQHTGIPDQRVTWLGMELMSYTESIARRIGADYFPGVYINSVNRGSPADRADILPGSIITQVNNLEVGNLDDLQSAAESIRDGKKAIPFLLIDPRGSIEYKAIRP
ncbi:MAG: trypsin-like peptidase domain-containing protein [Candidatus Zixiibacteriota bacterium]|nr:MAG: trypsin-like peptidase domain-containing protein [candidate division Zixibacteria bacterium]